MIFFVVIVHRLHYNKMNTSDSENENHDQEETPLQNEPLPTNDFMNQLTLETLMSRNNYNKYLAKKDPAGQEKKREYKQKLRKYMVDIVDITSRLIEDYEDSPNQDIQTTFADFSKAVINYLEMKELEKKNGYNQDDSDMGDYYKKDDDVMFDPNQMEECNHSLFDKPKWSGFNVKKKPLPKSQSQTVKRPVVFGGFGTGHFV